MTQQPRKDPVVLGLLKDSEQTFNQRRSSNQADILGKVGRAGRVRGRRGGHRSSMEAWLVGENFPPLLTGCTSKRNPASDPNSGQAKRKVVAPDSKSSVSKDANLPVYVCEAPRKRSCASNSDYASFLSGHKRLAPKDGDQERLVSSPRLLAFSVKRRARTSFRTLCKSTGLVGRSRV